VLKQTYVCGSNAIGSGILLDDNTEEQEESAWRDYNYTHKVRAGGGGRKKRK